MEPLRHILRHKKTSVKYYEAEATEIDHENRIIHINDYSDIKGSVTEGSVPFDYLVVGVGAENATFGTIFFLFWRDLPGHGRLMSFNNRYPWCEGKCLFPKRDYRCATDS